ncbi:MAG: hypothetical protein KY447_08365 [Actinobacteria bacterium]|nr:hypothetical protein [Actinomycetota bacterium]
MVYIPGPDETRTAMNQQHNASQPASGSTIIVVRALIDPVVEAHGFAPTSHYVEATGSE